MTITIICVSIDVTGTNNNNKDVLATVFRVPVVGIRSLWSPQILLKQPIHERSMPQENLPFFYIATTVDGILLKSG